jgi:hypothetical protein
MSRMVSGAGAEQRAAGPAVYAAARPGVESDKSAGMMPLRLHVLNWEHI